MSPTPNAAEMISVESISPITIRVDWARRRGMLRTPSLNRTGRRRAINATAKRQMVNRPTRTTRIVDIGIPKISCMTVLLRRYALVGGDSRRVEIDHGAHRRVVDQAVTHPHDAICLGPDPRVMGHDHQRQPL